MNIIQRTLMLLFVLVSINVYGQTAYTPLPYFCGFENPEDTAGTYGWKFEKRAKVGHGFVVGKAVHRMGSHAMYVSADEGATPGYSLTTTGSTVIAYKSFYLEKGVYDLMFEYRLQGEEHQESDVMRVAFYSGNKPTAVAMKDFPKYALDYPFRDINGEEIMMGDGYLSSTPRMQGVYLLDLVMGEERVVRKVVVE